MSISSSRFIFGIVLFMLCALGSFAQGNKADTIYLDKAFFHTDAGNHLYYRVITPIKKNKFSIADYYRNGNLKTFAYAKSKDPADIRGEVRHYHPWGKLQRISNFKKPNKGKVTYFDSFGHKSAEVNFKDNEKVGKEIYFNSTGEKVGYLKFKDGAPFEGIVPLAADPLPKNFFHFIVYENGAVRYYRKHYANGKLAMQMEMADAFYTPLQATFYDEKGKQLGQCTYHEKIPWDGLALTFYEDQIPGKLPAEPKFKTEFKKGTIIRRSSYDGHGDKIGECEYLNGRPWNGMLLQGNTASTFENGKIEGKVSTYTVDGKVLWNQFTLTNGSKEGETIFYCQQRDSLFKGTFINNEPYEGYVWALPELSKYQNGYKHGPSVKYDAYFHIEQVIHFLEGARDGYTVFNGHPSLGPIEGYYRRNRAYEGFFSNKKDPPTISYWEKGQKSSDVLYKGNPPIPFEKLEYDENKEIIARTIFEGTMESGSRVALKDGEMSSYIHFKEGMWTSGCYTYPATENSCDAFLALEICAQPRETKAILTARDGSLIIESQLSTEQSLTWPAPTEEHWQSMVKQQQIYFLPEKSFVANGQKDKQGLLSGSFFQCLEGEIHFSHQDNDYKLTDWDAFLQILNTLSEK